MTRPPAIGDPQEGTAGNRRHSMVLSLILGAANDAIPQDLKDGLRDSRSIWDEIQQALRVIA